MTRLVPEYGRLVYEVDDNEVGRLDLRRGAPDSTTGRLCSFCKGRFFDRTTTALPLLARVWRRGTRCPARAPSPRLRFTNANRHPIATAPPSRTTARSSRQAVPGTDGSGKIIVYVGDEPELVDMLVDGAFATRRNAAAYTFVICPGPSASLLEVLGAGAVEGTTPGRRLAAIFMIINTRQDKRPSPKLRRTLGDHLRVEDDRSVRDIFQRLLDCPPARPAQVNTWG